MIKRVRTWRNVVEGINRVIRSGNPAYLNIKDFSVVISDHPIPECKHEIIITYEVSMRELKSDILDYLSVMCLIRDNKAVQGVLDMLTLIEQWRWERYDTN